MSSGYALPATGRDTLNRKVYMITHENSELLEALTQSSVYQDYERAFTEATGLPMALRPVESWQLPHHGRKNANRFCALMATKSRACASCLQVQQQLAEQAREKPLTVSCELGLCDSAVPVKLGDRLIGFLQTGQVFTRKPSENQFQKAAAQAIAWGVEADPEQLRSAYFSTKVVQPRQYESILALLSIFAQHISMLSNQIALRQKNQEPPVITRAKAFIEAHQGEDLSLGQVARAVNTSTFYFCKIFKKGTGLNFTEYVSRMRIERSKNLLLNPNLRVSEIAYEVGFQSLTHFNRVFKKIVGIPPSEYRAQLSKA